MHLAAMSLVRQADFKKRVQGAENDLFVLIIYVQRYKMENSFNFIVEQI